MEIVLIRHAQSERWGGAGPADPQLTLSGISQAQELADYLAAPDAPEFTSLYTSTMTRAVETAAPIARTLGIPLTAKADLVEYDHDLNFYLPTEDIEANFEQYWNDLQEGTYVGHKLDLEAFQTRVVTAIDSIIETHEDEDRVAIVCHAGVISAFIDSMLGRSHPLFFEPDYTSISRIQVYPGGTRHVLSANETPHLGFTTWESALV